MQTKKSKTKWLFTIGLILAISTLFYVKPALAWNSEGWVMCDINQNGQVDYDDLRLENVGVNIESTTSAFSTWDTTDMNGFYYMALPDVPDSYKQYLDESTLPSDATFTIPAMNMRQFDLSDSNMYDLNFVWLIDSATCHPPEPQVGCRVTGGGNDTAGISVSGGWDQTMAEAKSRKNNQYNRYTFGGQAGASTGAQPQPKGEWTHHQQSGPDGSFVFHGGTASSPTGSEIDVIICSDEGFCDPAREAPNKQIDFAGIGTFKNIKNPSAAMQDVVPGESYHWFEVHIEDLGEPGNEPKSPYKGKNKVCLDEGSGTDAFADPPVFNPADCECADFYRIRIYKGVTPVFDASTGEVTNADKENIIYEAFGYIDGGNLQIHPPTGFDLK